MCSGPSATGQFPRIRRGQPHLADEMVGEEPGFGPGWSFIRVIAQGE